MGRGGGLDPNRRDQYLRNGAKESLSSGKRVMNPRHCYIGRRLKPLCKFATSGESKAAVQLNSDTYIKSHPS